MGHLALHQKIKNIRRDSRVVLSFLGDKTSENGLREYVVVHGHARVTEGGAVPLLLRIASLYVGDGAEYPPPSNTDAVYRHRPFGSTNYCVTARS